MFNARSSSSKQVLLCLDIGESQGRTKFAIHVCVFVTSKRDSVAFNEFIRKKKSKERKLTKVEKGRKRIFRLKNAPLLLDS
jgi:hypothetical protein